MKWIISPPDEAATADLAAQLNLCLPAARVLWSRGYRTPEAARKFFAPTLADLNDPYLMKDMDRAVPRLKAAILNKEKILLYGDYDVDGTSSVVVLKKGIELLGGTVTFHVPHRLRDGYGMRSEVVEQAATEGITLIVSVDTGIRANLVVEHAASLNIDVIVTDHHLPEAALPPAVAVLNPNRADCTYPEKNLCGAGVALKLIDALIAAFDWPNEKRERLIDSFLKIVAIATVADVVPLTGENRVIVKRGLSGLDQVRNPGLRALLDVSGFPAGKLPSAREIAFQVAPRINAAGRMASASDVIEMFLTNDPDRARDLASQLHELNKDRRQTEQEIAQSIVKLCLEQPVTDNDHALVFAGEGWHRGVVGIVASRVVERYHRPVFVLSIENGTAQGSGRSISAFHLLEALEHIALAPVETPSARAGMKKIGEAADSAQAKEDGGTPDSNPATEFSEATASNSTPEFAEATDHDPATEVAEATEGGLQPARGFSHANQTSASKIEQISLLTKFGGHHQAAGLTMPAEHVAIFRERFQSFAATRLTPADFEPEIQIDAEITIEEIAQACKPNDPTIAQILSLAPFGAGNPPPIFALRNAELAAPPEIKPSKSGDAKHVFLQIKCPGSTGQKGTGRPLRAKAWNFAERAAELYPSEGTPTDPAAGPLKVDLAIQFEDDSYSAARGYAPWQTVVKDVRPAQAAAKTR